MDNVKQFLSNIYENYLLDTKSYVHTGYKMKCLGAMEALLVLMGVLGAGIPLDYQKNKTKFYFLWLIPVPITRKETYEELILRLTYETLNKE